MRGERLELVGRGDKGQPVMRAMLAATVVSQPGAVLSPVPTAVPPCASS